MITLILITLLMKLLMTLFLLKNVFLYRRALDLFIQKLSH